MEKWIKCVIFDVDGTLAQTNQLILESFNFISEKYINKRFIFEELTKMFGPPEEVALKNLLGDKYSENILKEFLDYYKANHQKIAELYPAIKEILNFLKQKKVYLGIFTGKGKSTTNITLDELSIKKYFDIIITGNDVLNHKPSSEGIEKIVRYFNVSKNQTIMVGDAVADIKAAKDAGIKIAAVLWDSYSKEKIKNLTVDYMFESTYELKNFFEKNV